MGGKIEFHKGAKWVNAKRFLKGPKCAGPNYNGGKVDIRKDNKKATLDLWGNFAKIDTNKDGCIQTKELEQVADIAFLPKPNVNIQDEFMQVGKRIRGVALALCSKQEASKRAECSLHGKIKYTLSYNPSTGLIKITQSSTTSKELKELAEKLKRMIFTSENNLTDEPEKKEDSVNL